MKIIYDTRNEYTYEECTEGIRKLEWQAEVLPARFQIMRHM